MNSSVKVKPMPITAYTFERGKIILTVRQNPTEFTIADKICRFFKMRENRKFRYKTTFSLLAE